MDPDPEGLPHVAGRGAVRPRRRIFIDAPVDHVAGRRPVRPHRPGLIDATADKALEHLEGLLAANARNRPGVRPEEYSIGVDALHNLFEAAITQTLGAPPPTPPTPGGTEAVEELQARAAYDRRKKILAETLERRIGASKVESDGRYRIDELVRSIREVRSTREHKKRHPTRTRGETPSPEHGG